MTPPSLVTPPNLATRLWPFAPAFLLCSLIGTQLLVLQAVLFDPGFSVETDYYQKAMNWDARQQQARQRLSLGWQLNLKARHQAAGTLIEVQLRDRNGNTLSGTQLTLEAFAISRAQHQLHEKFQPLGAGSYRTLLNPSSSGLWELRVRVRADGVDYVESLRRDLIAGQMAQGQP